jgi:hypothetical protein
VSSLSPDVRCPMPGHRAFLSSGELGPLRARASPPTCVSPLLQLLPDRQVQPAIQEEEKGVPPSAARHRLPPLVLDKKGSNLPTDTTIEEVKAACRDKRDEWVQMERAANRGSATDSSVRQREQSILDSYRSYLNQRQLRSTRPIELLKASSELPDMFSALGSSRSVQKQLDEGNERCIFAKSKEVAPLSKPS